jgi:transposase
MGKYIEVFVAFDVAKKKHAVAIADGERTGEVPVSRRRREQPVADRANDQEIGGPIRSAAYLF